MITYCLINIYDGYIKLKDKCSNKSMSLPYQWGKLKRSKIIKFHRHRSVRAIPINGFLGTVKKDIKKLIN